MQQSTNSRVELPNAKGEEAQYCYEAVVLLIQHGLGLNRIQGSCALSLSTAIADE